MVCGISHRVADHEGLMWKNRSSNNILIQYLITLVSTYMTVLAQHHVLVVIWCINYVNNFHLALQFT